MYSIPIGLEMSTIISMWLVDGEKSLRTTDPKRPIELIEYLSYSSALSLRSNGPAPF